MKERRLAARLKHRASVFLHPRGKRREKQADRKRGLVRGLYRGVLKEVSIITRVPGKVRIKNDTLQGIFIGWGKLLHKSQD